MGIGSITSTNSMSSAQMIAAASTNSKIKSIENEITNAKQQMQKLSSKEELSVSEKTNERKKQQKEISGLNIELKQRQEELRKSQKREIMMAKLQEERKPAKEEKADDSLRTKEASSNAADEKKLPTDERQTGRQETVIAKDNDGAVILKEEMNQDGKSGIEAEKAQADETKEKGAAKKEAKSIDGDAAANTGLSRKEMYAIASADSSVQQAGKQGTVITRIRNGIAILKGETNQDENRGVNAEKTQTELEKMEKKEQRAMAFQFSILGEANNAMKSAAGTNMFGAKDKTQINAKNNAFINALKISQEEGKAAQQMFLVV